MCTVTSIQADLRVSVQLRGAADRSEGHLAAGMLADSDVVLVPRPPAAVLEPTGELEVMIIPVPPRREMLVERFGPRKMISYGRRVAPERPTVVAIKLAGFSRYAAQVGEFRAARLSGALEERDGDWWAAMESIGAVRPGIEQIPADVFEQLPRIEEEQHRPRLRVYLDDSYADLVGRVCPLNVCRCQEP